MHIIRQTEKKWITTCTHLLIQKVTTYYIYCDEIHRKNRAFATDIEGKWVMWQKYRQDINWKDLNNLKTTHPKLCVEFSLGFFYTSHTNQTLLHFGLHQIIVFVFDEMPFNACHIHNYLLYLKINFSVNISMNTFTFIKLKWTS